MKTSLCSVQYALSCCYFLQRLHDPFSIKPNMTFPVVYRQATRAIFTCLRSDVQKGDGRRLSSTTEEKHKIKVSVTKCGMKGSQPTVELL